MDRPIALVTGASRGIGKAIAVALAQAGHDLVIAARTLKPGESRDHSLSVHRTDARPLPGSLEETAQAVEAEGARVLKAPMDLTDRASVEEAARLVLALWGRVDVLVHNGRHLGPGLMDLFLDTPVDAYPKFFEAHAMAPIILTRTFLPGMLERGGGQVLTITSSAAHDIPPAPPGKGGWGLAYAMGKAAGHPLAGALHAEFRERGIRAFNVDPGFVGTERNQITARDHGHDVSRAAPPAAIGAAVAWLVTTHEGALYAGTGVKAQDLCLELNLHPTWR